MSSRGTRRVHLLSAGTHATRGRQSTEDAYMTMMLVHDSISGADGKASILGTASAVVVGLVAGSLDLTVLDGGSVGQYVWVGLGLAAIGAVVVTAGELAGVLIPRVGAERFSRYAWPAIVDLPLSRLVLADDRSDREEAWAQAQMLARISRIKHLHLRRAFTWFAGAVALAGAWALVGASFH